MAGVFLSRPSMDGPAEPADAFAAFRPCRAVCLPTRLRNRLFPRKTVPRRHVERPRWPIFRKCVQWEYRSGAAGVLGGSAPSNEKTVIRRCKAVIRRPGGARVRGTRTYSAGAAGDNRGQSPLNNSGQSPLKREKQPYRLFFSWPLGDLNPRPTDYESAALTN